MPSSCGDDAACLREDGAVVLCLADGLGHGPEAAEAARRAIAFVSEHPGLDIPETFRGCDQALRSTRGAALSIGRLRAGVLSYGAVGNTQAMVVGAKTARFPSTPGIVGAGYATLRIEQASVREGDLVVMWSDGLKSAVGLESFGAILLSEPQALAERILRDFSRGTDDASVLVYREG